MLPSPHPHVTFLKEKKRGGGRRTKTMSILGIFIWSLYVQWEKIYKGRESTVREVYNRLRRNVQYEKICNFFEIYSESISEMDKGEVHVIFLSFLNFFQIMVL